MGNVILASFYRQCLGPCLFTFFFFNICFALNISTLENVCLPSYFIFVYLLALNQFSNMLSKKLSKYNFPFCFLKSLFHKHSKKTRDDEERSNSYFFFCNT